MMPFACDKLILHKMLLILVLSLVLSCQHEQERVTNQQPVPVTKAETGARLQDSLLYLDDSAYSESPYKIRIYAAALEAGRDAEADSNYDGDHFRTGGELSVVDEEGKILPWKEYARNFRGAHRLNLACFLKVRIDWTGKIREVGLLRHDGQDLDQVDLKDLASRTRDALSGL